GDPVLRRPHVQEAQAAGEAQDHPVREAMAVVGERVAEGGEPAVEAGQVALAEAQGVGGHHCHLTTWSWARTSRRLARNGASDRHGMSNRRAQSLLNSSSERRPLK